MINKKKSKSQTLRAVLFLYWDENKHKIKIPFEDFYNKKMDMLIEDIKKKLNN